MNGGVGTLSYAKNSKHQGLGANAFLSVIKDEISKKLDVDKVLSTKPDVFSIADFGCATGYNSFPVVEAIVSAVEEKLQHSNPEYDPDFHVLFNDQPNNDFNTLFTALPSERRYHAAGVPGSFYARLLPKNTLHIAYSAWSLNWLSQQPKPTMVSSNDPSWNKWKSYCPAPAGKENLSGYLNQFAKDTESFLESRAQELVAGGLIVLLIGAVPDLVDPQADMSANLPMFHLGCCLQDMANEGKISEAELESFNFPVYFPSLGEVKSIVERCDSFSIERLEMLNGTEKIPRRSAKAAALTTRSITQGLLTSAFGSEILDELFERFELSFSKLYVGHEEEKTTGMILILSRNARI